MLRLPDEPIVVPSILAADPALLYEQVVDVVDAGARAIHVDVMDGRFVATRGFRPETVAALRHVLGAREVLLDVHLMVERPERMVPAFAMAGADSITVHVEASTELLGTIDLIHEYGCFAGVALSPSTPVAELDAVAEELDLALCMTVEPGYGGQRFIETSPARVSAIAQLVARVEVDGGIDAVTGRACLDAGASLLVAGSTIFRRDDPAAAFAELNGALAKERV
jgi:ribulose-phosphate 3-epimerase